MRPLAEAKGSGQRADFFFLLMFYLEKFQTYRKVERIIPHINILPYLPYLRDRNFVKKNFFRKFQIHINVEQII